MVGILTGIVIGTLAGMAISAAAVIYGSVKGAPRDRAAKLQKKAYKGKISGKRLRIPTSGLDREVRDPYALAYVPDFCAIKFQLCS